MANFEVIGDVLGDVMGDVDGDLDGDVDGDEVVGAITKQGRVLRLANKAGWRKSQLAPGVVAPGEGLVPLPMTPQQNNGTFTSLVTSITWQGQLQKPFRSERLLVRSIRTGATSVGALLGQIFVGTDLQQAEISGMDLELVGANTAFGTRLTLIQAPPGVLVRIPVVLSSGLTAPDTVFASMMFLGRVVH
jgi:hypothetical protein